MKYFATKTLSRSAFATLSIPVILLLAANAAAGESEVLLTSSYHTLNEIYDIFYDLSSTHVDIAHLDTLGFSVRGLPIIALMLSDNPGIEETEPTFIFDGYIHGNELIGGEVVLALACSLCAGYGNDQMITDLIDENELWIVPLVNPDGVAARTRQNANGVDINRDFGYQWGGTGFSPYPFSQPETRIRRDLSLQNKPVSSINFHSGIIMYIFSWANTFSAAPDSTELFYLGKRYTQFYPFRCGQISREHLPWLGCSSDFYYGCYGEMAMVNELWDDFVPPPSLIETICEMNVAGCLDMIDVTGRGVRGIVSDVSTGSPLPARIEVIDSGWQVYTDAVLGDYYRFLLPGAYQIRAHANGYISSPAEPIQIPSDGYIEHDFSLQPSEPDEVHFGAFAVVACQITSYMQQPAVESPYFTLSLLGMQDDQVLEFLPDLDWVILDMGQATPIEDASGADFTVHALTSEGQHIVEVSGNIDGPFYQVGTASGTEHFDISSTGLLSARYVRISSTGNLTLDAVTTPVTQLGAGPAEPDTPMVSLVHNPCSILMLIVHSGSSYFTVKIYDITGRQVLSERTDTWSPGDEYCIDWFPNGIYLISISDGFLHQVLKAVVIK
ncbi:MAG: hypothetical protein KAR44_09675 [Candidatus Aegiribacteria sp.]|nr:hypothetical protein [Candidatus Aegiribacteria sp.]